MCDIVEQIAQADEVELQTLLKAVLQRYAVLFPDWEMSILSLQKSSDQNEQLDRIIELLQNMKTIS